MKQVFLFWWILIAGLAYIGMGPDALVSRIQKQTTEASVAGEWYLQPVLASDTATGKLPVIRFDLVTKRFTGFTGCNQMNGRFILSGNQLSVDKDITLTKIACEGFNEKEFLINLLRVTHYTIKDGVLLLLIDKVPVSKWIRKTGKNELI